MQPSAEMEALVQAIRAAWTRCLGGSYPAMLDEELERVGILRSKASLPISDPFPFDPADTNAGTAPDDGHPPLTPSHEAALQAEEAGPLTIGAFARIMEVNTSMIVHALRDMRKSLERRDWPYFSIIAPGGPGAYKP